MNLPRPSWSLTTSWPRRQTSPASFVTAVAWSAPTLRQLTTSFAGSRPAGRWPRFRSPAGRTTKDGTPSRPSSGLSPPGGQTLRGGGGPLCCSTSGSTRVRSLEPDDDRFGLRALEHVIRVWPDPQDATRESRRACGHALHRRPIRPCPGRQPGRRADLRREDGVDPRAAQGITRRARPDRGHRAPRQAGRSSRPRSEPAAAAPLREARVKVRHGSGNLMILGPQGAGKNDLGRVPPRPVRTSRPVRLVHDPEDHRAGPIQDPLRGLGRQLHRSGPGQRGGTGRRRPPGYAVSRRGPQPRHGQPGRDAGVCPPAAGREPLGHAAWGGFRPSPGRRSERAPGQRAAGGCWPSRARWRSMCCWCRPPP